MTDSKPSAAAVWTGRIISWILGLGFIASAALKFVRGPEFEKGIDHLGLPESIITPLAILEITCAVIYLIPQTAVLGAVLLTGYVGGAICTHWRVGDPFYIQAGLGVLVWLGLYLRDARLRPLLPFRR
jgi:hypothetical protein